MAGQGRENALDHVSWWCLRTGRWTTCWAGLYGPGDGKTPEDAIGKDLSNPILEWAEHAVGYKVVPYTVATDMDSRNPDTGEEHPHTNSRLFNILSGENRFKLAGGMTAPYGAPAPGLLLTVDGFVAGYISTLTGRAGPPAPARSTRR